MIVKAKPNRDAEELHRAMEKAFSECAISRATVVLFAIDSDAALLLFNFHRAYQILHIFKLCDASNYLLTYNFLLA